MLRTMPIHTISLPTPWPAVGPIHVYLVRQDPLTLIDAGLHLPESREALLAGLREVGVELHDIRRILLTHAHLDHCGQAAWIQEESGAEVWLHPDEVGKMDSTDWWQEGRHRTLMEAGVPAEKEELMEQLWQLNRQLLLPLADWKPLMDGQRFAFESGELKAVHLPGHALGHTGFYDRESGLLMGGDHLLDGITPNPILEPVLPGHPAAVPHAPHRALTLGQFLGALERVSAMPVRRVYPGHGQVIDDHAAIAASYRAKHEKRLGSLYDRLGEGKTVYELTQEAYPWVKEFNVFLALSEVLAHLDLLVVRGRVALEPGEHGNLYRPL